MTVGDLFLSLGLLPNSAILSQGLKNPHSYRGDYEQLAFEPCGEMTVADVIEVIEEGLLDTHAGYKGGAYKMSEDSDVFVAFEGCTGSSMHQIIIEGSTVCWACE